MRIWIRNRMKAVSKIHFTNKFSLISYTLMRSTYCWLDIYYFNILKGIFVFNGTLIYTLCILYYIFKLHSDISFNDVNKYEHK